jgi:hypothetical protein
MDDLKLINARLQELNKEFRDLSALKKELQDKQKAQTIKDKYGEFKFMIKSPTIIEEIDFEKLMKEADLQVGRNEFGLPVIAYNFGNGVSYLSIIKSENDVYTRVAVDNLLKIADSIKEEFKSDQTKIFEASEIFLRFEEALDVKSSGVTTVTSNSENLSE